MKEQSDESQVDESQGIFSLHIQCCSTLTFIQVKSRSGGLTCAPEVQELHLCYRAVDLFPNTFLQVLSLGVAKSYGRTLRASCSFLTLVSRGRMEGCAPLKSKVRPTIFSKW